MKNASLEKFQIVKEKLAKVGISIKRNLRTEEYQVYPKGDEPGEDSTYFTHKLTESDLEDALNTGLDMAKRLKARKNPKCKTIEVRRKIRILGKPRVVKVKRKICNPKNEGGYYKSMTYGKLPTFKEFEKAFDEQVDGLTYRIRNDKMMGNVDLTVKELWHYLKLAVHDGSEKALDWASVILDTLGFEWI